MSSDAGPQYIGIQTCNHEFSHWYHLFRIHHKYFVALAGKDTFTKKKKDMGWPRTKN